MCIIRRAALAVAFTVMSYVAQICFAVLAVLHRRPSSFGGTGSIPCAEYFH
jgi:hypothetical protein